jgi:diaminopimelate epimerase
MNMHIASASGNVFGYFWADQVPDSFHGPGWAKHLCPRGLGFGLDGIFLLSRPISGEAWSIEHWDSDGSHSFCSNGNRAALALDGAPKEEIVSVISAGVACLLRQEPKAIGIRMPEGEGFGLRPLPISVSSAAGFGFIGNPQLVLRVASVAEVDLAQLAPPLRFDPAFPEGTNVNVIEVMQPGEARIRSWERGVEGETLCCGTGCGVAAAWLAQSEGIRTWKLHTASGDPVMVSLELEKEGRWRELWLSGPVRRLGTLSIDPSFDLT